MPIKIETVRITGFRGLSNIEVNLDRTTVLIGMNNAGKTSFLKALQIAFGDWRFVSEDDFHIDANEIKANAIVIDVLVIPTDDKHQRVPNFDRVWGNVFRNDIVMDDGGNAFLAFRTTISLNDDQKRFYPSRLFMTEWPSFAEWQENRFIGRSKVPNLSEHMPYLFQDAQRDITEDIKLRNSPLGRVLSKVKYDEDDISALQDLIDELNSEAVKKSDVLSSLQSHLSELGHAIGNRDGNTEITPFAKQIRDLAKGIRLNYQEGANSFSMEYHGMGTKSWASLLVIKAFVKMLSGERAAENRAFLPILALEEPEAHLHPNAQKQLYRQMQDFPGQTIISTHSPYVAARADIGELRAFYRGNSGLQVNALPGNLTPDEKRKIQREVVEGQGELLFSRILVLQEGQTETQILSQMIEAYLGQSSYNLGVTTIHVGGYANYNVFLKVASALKIPVIVYSDTDDARVRDKVEKSVLAVYGSASGPENETIFLDQGNNLEQQLVREGFRDEVIESLIRYKLQNNDNPKYRNALETQYSSITDEELLTEMTSKKTTYSHFLGDVFLNNPKGRDESTRFPISITRLCRKIESWWSMG